MATRNRMNGGLNRIHPATPHDRHGTGGWCVSGHRDDRDDRNDRGRPPEPPHGTVFPRSLPLLPLLLAMAVLLSATPSRAASFSTSLDRRIVPLGEPVTLSLTFEGATPNNPPVLPAFAGVQIQPNVSQQSQFSFVNGQQTSRLTYSYTLQPTTVGNLTIPSLQVVVGNQTLTSQPLTLQVVAANTPPNSPNNSISNLAFVRLVVPKSEVYVGEPFALEIQLYVQAAKDVRMPQLAAEGFSVSKIPQPSQTRTSIGNTVYELVLFRMTATAARSGNLTLGPVEQQLRILIPAPNQRGRDPFDSLFFGGPRYQELPTTLKSDSIPMRVLPLPQQGVPAGYNGAIGTFQMAVTAGPTNMAVGDPITVRVQLDGQGPLESLNFPTQAGWRDFTTYPATSRIDSSDDFGLVGRKTFEQVIVPQNHELKALPPVEFSFFDPAARGYRTLTGPLIPLTIRPSPTAAPPPPPLTNSAPAGQPGAGAADDILHIKPHLDARVASGPWLLHRPWFLALQLVPLVAWGILLGRRRALESLANNPRLRRQREVAQKIREGIAELQGHAAQGQSDPFFSGVFRLLQEQVGERLNLPASAITEAVIDERLQERGLSPAARQSLHDLFQACNLARYAPVQSRQELAAFIPKLESALGELQQLKS